MDDTPLPFFQRFLLAYVAFFGVLFDGRFAARVQAVRAGVPELPPRPDETAKGKASKDDDSPRPAEKSLATEPDDDPAEQTATKAAVPAAKDLEPDEQTATKAAVPAAKGLDPKATLAAVPAAKKKVAATSSAVPEPEDTRNLEPALLLIAALQRGGRLVDFLQQDVTEFPDEEIGAAARVVHEGCRKELLKHVTFEPIRAEDEGTTLTLKDDFDRNAVKLTGNVGGKAPYQGVLRHRGWRVSKLELARTVSEHDPHVVAPAEVEL